MENELSDFIVENGPNQSRSSTLKSWLDKADWLLFFSSVPENLQFYSLAQSNTQYGLRPYMPHISWSAVFITNDEEYKNSILAMIHVRHDKIELQKR